ncbi:MAG: rod shape-determining protein MreC [Oscillospiraceae bacterium]|nr:rod shape-determining protein MreC [Candidatus Limimonas coprohippi]MCQ2487864.1 rod shape-determining protein MreC [Clostridia bacterium]
MNRFVKSTWFKIIVAFVAILFVLLIFAAASKKGSSPLSSVIGAVTEPFSHVSSSIGNGLSGLGGGLRSKAKYEEEIKGLKKQIAGYQKELADYEQIKQQNELYQNALGVKEKNPDFEFVYATVIGRDAADVYTSFTLSKGSKDGISVDDPVICGEGQLVGIVKKVADTYCVVSTILDPKVSVSAYEVRTRETGYVSNTTLMSETGYIKVAGLSRTTSVTAGGVVCSTGVGGVFPRDLIIGTVKEVKDDDHTISSYLVIEPTVSIKDIENVLVITNFEGQGVTVS